MPQVSAERGASGGAPRGKSTRDRRTLRRTLTNSGGGPHQINPRRPPTPFLLQTSCLPSTSISMVVQHAAPPGACWGAQRASDCAIATAPLRGQLVDATPQRAAQAPPDPSQASSVSAWDALLLAAGHLQSDAATSLAALDAATAQHRHTAASALRRSSMRCSAAAAPAAAPPRVQRSSLKRRSPAAASRGELRVAATCVAACPPPHLSPASSAASLTGAMEAAWALQLQPHTAHAPVAAVAPALRALQLQPRATHAPFSAAAPAAWVLQQQRYAAQAPPAAAYNCASAVADAG